MSKKKTKGFYGFESKEAYAAYYWNLPPGHWEWKAMEDYCRQTEDDCGNLETQNGKDRS